MSKKFDIDKAFRNISRKHQATYDPKDWISMQEKLKEAGLQTHTNWLDRFAIIVQKSLIVLTTLGLILLPSGRITQINPLNDSFAYDINSTIKNSDTQAIAPQEKSPQANTSMVDPELAEQIVSIDQNYSYVNLENTSIAENLRETKTLESIDKYLTEETWKSLIQKISEIKSALYFSNNLEDVSSNVDSLPSPNDSVIALHEPPLHYDIAKNFSPQRSFQASIFPPLGTHGTQAKYAKNDYSVNLFLGSSTETGNLEVSGLGSVVQKKVKGGQVSGMFNANKGDLEGLQMAGFVNLSAKNTQGAQIGGLVNISGHQKEKVSEEHEGGNVQIAGLYNASFKHQKNSQVSGLVNQSNHIQGVQIAGLTNIAKEVEGVQIGGLINVARRVKGVQIGLINVADSIQGVPIGLFNYVKHNGYRHIEFWGGETFHANVALKIGVRRLYNILAVGIQNPQNPGRWGLGFGMGSQLELGNQGFMNIELLAYHVNETESFTKRFNLLNQFRFNLGLDIGDHFSIFGGPSINVLMSDFKNENNSIGSQIAPSWILFEGFTQGTSIRAWLGFNVGVKF